MMAVWAISFCFTHFWGPGTADPETPASIGRTSPRNGAPADLTTDSLYCRELHSREGCQSCMMDHDGLYLESQNYVKSRPFGLFLKVLGHDFAYLWGPLPSPGMGCWYKHLWSVVLQYLPRPPNVPLLRALWSLLDGIWGVLKGSWGLLVFIATPLPK